MYGKLAISIISLALLIAGCGDRRSIPDSKQPAEFVFLHGGIYTVDPAQPWAEAASVRGGEIVFVGNDSEARSMIGPDTVVMDLNGRLLLPGFHDAHVHLAEGDSSYEGCSLAELYSIEEIRQKLEICTRLAGRGDDGWIVGGGWDRPVFGGLNPEKALLDEFFPDRPAYFIAQDGHSGWVNSKALELAGIDRDTKDEPRRKIDRDPETGSPTGILDELAMDFVARIIPPLRIEARIEQLLGNIATAHRFGITSIIDPAVGEVLLEPYVALDQSGGLELRVGAGLSSIGWFPGAFGAEIYDMIATRDKYRGVNLRPDSVKIFADGILENGTGALVEPYIGEAAHFGHGTAHYSQEDLNEYVRRFDADGIQIIVHAIGDLGVRMALDAFEAARKANGETGNRHHIDHLQLIHPDDIARFGELGIAAVFQALWALPDDWIMELNLPWVGQERVDRMYPIASVQKTGGLIVGGSDWFVSSMNPLDAIEVGVRRQFYDTEDSPVLNQQERVDLATMIESYTINGAWLMGQDDIVGSIEVGKRADLVVLDRNIFEIPATEINEAKVVLTLFDGKPVYRSDVLH